MKYNRSQIMERAHELRKASNPRITMSDALRASWKQAKWNAYKEEHRMKGSEKQVKWAEEIQSRVINTFERLKAERADNPAEVAYSDKMIAAVKSAAYASSIINLFKYYHPNGDMQHDVMSLAAIYRVTIPNGDDERAILCK